MSKIFNLTESEKSQILKMHEKRGYNKSKNESPENNPKDEMKESFWNSIFGNPTVGDAAHTQLRGQGYSHMGKDDGERSDENYLVFQGQKFYPEQIQYADYQDTGDLPRVEDGMLIISNPSWSM